MGLRSMLLFLAGCLLWRPMEVQGACCTSGQPTYNGSVVNVYGISTCSDGPCSGVNADTGLSFNYLVPTTPVTQSPDPDSCCQTAVYNTANDREGVIINGFWYNPQSTSGLFWQPDYITGSFPGTGRTCDAKKPVFLCGFEGNQRATCYSLTSAPGSTYCPPGTAYDPAQAANTNPNTTICCKATTCQDINPAIIGDQNQECNPGFEYDPAKANVMMPGPDRCCKRSATCGDTNADGVPEPSYTCPPGFELDANKTANVLNATGEGDCCKPLPTCGDTNPTTNPGTPYNCSAVAPAGTWFYDMSTNMTINLNVTVCCKQGSCFDRNPLDANTTESFDCGEGYELKENPGQIKAWTKTDCCKPLPTCGDTEPVTRPGTPYNCSAQTPAGTWFYDMIANNTLNPNITVCCKQGSCADRNPLDANTTESFDCGAGYELKEDPGLTKAWTKTDCCKKSPTCGDTNGELPNSPTYAKCAAGFEYDLTKVNVTLNATGYGDCCKKSPTCGDTDGNGTPGPVYGNCTTGFEYDTTKVNITLNATGYGDCCKKSPTCGDPDGNPATNATYDKCGFGYTYDISKKNNTLDASGTGDCCVALKLASCGDTDVSTPDVQEKFICNVTDGWVFNPDKSGYSAPLGTTLKQADCCLRQTCQDTLNFTTPGADRWVCGKGWVYNPNFDKASPPSDQNCCLYVTCLDTDPLTAKLDMYQCPKGYTNNRTADRVSPPSDDLCCMRAATCGDPNADGAPGPNYTCVAGFEIDVNKSANVLDTSGKGDCCKKSATCGDPDADGHPGPAYDDCDTGFTYNSSKAANVLDAEGLGDCCQAIPATCNNIDPTYIPAESYDCSSEDPEGGWVYDPAKGGKTNPSRDVCCKQSTCADPNPLDNKVTPIDCGAGWKRLPGSDSFSPGTQETCCTVEAPPQSLKTCGDPNGDGLAGPPYSQCGSGQVPDPNKSSNPLGSDGKGDCCMGQKPLSPKCKDADGDPSNGEVPYACQQPGWEYVDKNSDRYPPSDSKCCVPTCCEDVDPNQSGNQPFHCSSPYVYNSANARKPVGDGSACCIIPKCKDVDTVRWGDQNYNCPAPLRYDPKKAYNLADEPSDCCTSTSSTCEDLSGGQQWGGWKYSCSGGKVWDYKKRSKSCTKYSPPDICCTQPTCKDVSPDKELDQNYNCPSGYTFDPTKADTYATQSSPASTCCKRTYTPPPPCKFGNDVCPSFTQDELASSFTVSPSRSSNTATVSFTNKFIYSASCGQGVSWITISSCSQCIKASPSGGCNIGTSVGTLNNVPCGSYVYIIAHDGSYKKRCSNNRKPADVVLDTCPASMYSGGWSSWGSSSSGWGKLSSSSSDRSSRGLLGADTYGSYGSWAWATLSTLCRKTGSSCYSNDDSGACVWKFQVTCSKRLSLRKLY